MTQSFEPITVQISQLIEHPANVRTNSEEAYTPESVAHLKASIGVLGLLQPLLVQKIDGKYGVLAGGRRRAALSALARDKTVKGFNTKTSVPCCLVPDGCDVTTALSLAENILQEPMSPIDEYEAFARMLEVDGQSVETIAKTFGTTEAAVKGRLRFGLVHPDIRAAVRDKTITIDTMKAFANHPNQDVQREVFIALQEADSRIYAHDVRRALQNRGVQAGDALAMFVREEYEARGGAIAADLIAEHSVLEDQQLIEDILTERLKDAAEADRAAHGFAWADTLLTFDHGAMMEWGRVYPKPIEPNEDQAKRIDAIEEEIGQLALRMEDESVSDEDYAALEDRVEALEDEARTLQEAYTQEDLAGAGVIASWSRGEIVMHRGLVRPEDKKSAAAGSTSSKNGTEQSTTDEISYGGSLSDDLRTERAMALGAAMAMHPEATLDLTLFKLVMDVLGTSVSTTHALKIHAQKQYRTHAKMDELDSTSLDQMGEAYDALNLTWLGEDSSPAEQFALFRALSAEDKAKLVAYASGSTTLSCFARDAQTDPLMHDFEIEVMPNLRAHWTPNAAFFSRLKKAWLIKVLSEELGLAQEAATLASQSKKDIVAFMDKLFAAPFATLTPEQLTAVETWCPPCMQTTHPEIEDGTVDAATDITDDMRKAA